MNVNLKKVIEDIQLGLSDHELMAKYQLSAAQFANLMKKLDQAGLHKKQLGGPSDSSRHPAAGDFYQCPVCGCARIEPFDECPKCGVIVSKLGFRPLVSSEKHSLSGLPADPEQSKHREDSMGMWQDKRWLIFVAAIIIVIGAIVGIIWLYHHY